MKSVRIYNSDIPREILELERAKRYRDLAPEEKLFQLLALIDAAKKLNNGEPLKQPQGKGIIIKKKNTQNVPVQQ